MPRHKFAQTREEFKANQVYQIQQQLNTSLFLATNGQELVLPNRFNKKIFVRKNSHVIAKEGEIVYILMPEDIKEMKRRGEWMDNEKGKEKESLEMKVDEIVAINQDKPQDANYSSDDSEASDSSLFRNTNRIQSDDNY